MIWTQEMADAATAMWKAGKSASQIAEGLGSGVTRNAVCGKMFRLRRDGADLTHTKAQASPAAPKPARMRKAATPTEAVRSPVLVFDLTLDLPSDGGIEIDALRNNTCRWPAGDPRDPEFRFCGAPDADLEIGRPYCARHSAIAYAPPRQRVKPVNADPLADLRKATRDAIMRTA